MIGDYLNPILLFLGSVAVAWSKVSGIFKNRKTEKDTQDLKDILNAILGKNTCEQEVSSLADLMTRFSERISTIEGNQKAAINQNILLGQMIATIFENSTLPIEAKEHLQALKCNLEYGVEGDYLENLLKENKELKAINDKMKETFQTMLKESTPTQTPTIEESKPSYIQVT